MQKLVSYASGALALLVVAVATAAALYYAVMNGLATLSNLATSTLSGIGISIGSCIGAGLILRFKSARRYVANVLKDVSLEKSGLPYRFAEIAKCERKVSECTTEIKP
jgi:hypothetical protein